MKTIIVPTDFSSIATNAMHYGIDMAKAVQASLLLLHVYQVPVSFTDTPIVLVSLEDLRIGAEEQIEKLKQYRKCLIHECVTGKRKVIND